MLHDKRLYEQWGIDNGIDVIKMNILDDRMAFIADTMGITELQEKGEMPDSIQASAYSALVMAEYQDLYEDELAGAFTGYQGCRWYSEYSNGVVSGSSAWFPPTYLACPSWFATFVPWLHNNAEAVRFYKSLSEGNKSITVRPYRWPFFLNPPSFLGFRRFKPTQHTVILRGVDQEVLLPFTGPVGS